MSRAEYIGPFGLLFKGPEGNQFGAPTREARDQLEDMLRSWHAQHIEVSLPDPPAAPDSLRERIGSLVDKHALYSKDTLVQHLVSALEQHDERSAAPDECVELEEWARGAWRMFRPDEDSVPKDWIDAYCEREEEQPSKAADDDLPSIAGRRMERSVADFVRACRVLIAEEQRKPLPDNALIGVLCDAVRYTRETDPASAPQWTKIAERAKARAEAEAEGGGDA